MIKRKKSKSVIASLAVIAVLSLSVSTALAAPPANDDFDSAIEIDINTLPFMDTLDTSEATEADDDPDCAGRGATVWYVLPVGGTDMRIEANTFGSDYDTTLSVYTGSRGALTQIACNDDAGGLQSRVVFDAVAGETYFIMAGSFASGPGGNLVFSVDVAPPPLEIDLSINPTGLFNSRTGVATIRGTVTCSRPAFVDLFGELTQKVGRFLIRGFFGTFFECDGETAWSATVTSDNGLYLGGPANATVFAFAFDPFTGDFAEDQASRKVTLRARR